MTRIHTHYDNLKVTRDASPEEIRDAYKSLAQKYHPDRNHGNNKATEIMAIINTSYDVLSNPNKRREHDLWVANQELAFSKSKQQTYQNQKPNNQKQFYCAACGQATVHDYKGYCTACGRNAAADANHDELYEKQNSDIWSVARFVMFALLAFGLYIIIEDPYAKYAKPSSAPNGQPWPVSAGYIDGYKQLHFDGLSTVTLDNSKRNSDLFVKLVSLDRATAYPVRHFYIPAYGSFTIDRINAGSYDIRYLDLGNGSLSRTKEFNLEENQFYNEVQSSHITISLHKVPNGNMKTYPLSEADF